MNKTIRIKAFAKLLLTITFLTFNGRLIAQISITEIETETKSVYYKPSDIDSTKAIRIHPDDIREYKKYIGTEVYLPPRTIEQLENLEYNNDDSEFRYPFLFSTDLNRVKPRIEKELQLSEHIEGMYRAKDSKQIEYQYILSNIYEPFHYATRKSATRDGAGEGIISRVRDVELTNGNSVGNKYYIILDVIYGDRLDSIEWQVKSEIRSQKDSLKQIISNAAKQCQEEYPNCKVETLSGGSYPKYYRMDRTLGESVSYGESELVVFKLLDKSSNRTLYSTRINEPFISVPHFIYMQNKYKTKTFIANYKYSDPTEYDKRIIEKTEDASGKIKEQYKEISIVPESIWKCIDVTLLKPDYNITYILENENNERIYIGDLSNFILKSEFDRKKLDEETKRQLKEKENQERVQKLKEVQAKLLQERQDIIYSKYGAELGEIILKNTVQLGMTKEMCIDSWGEPFWTEKKTNKLGTREILHYSFGVNLKLMDNKLYEVNE